MTEAQRAHKRDYDASRYVTHRDILLARSRRYHHANREEITARMRRRKYFANYGITPAEYDQMYEAQGGLCAICEKYAATLPVDHNHTTGVVRALLCRQCNVGIGMFHNSPDRLVRAAEYLDNHDLG